MKTKKVILLTGASSGIGYDTAMTLAKQGHSVYAAARRMELMEPLKEFGVKVINFSKSAWMGPTRENRVKNSIENAAAMIRFGI